MEDLLEEGQQTPAKQTQVAQSAQVQRGARMPGQCRAGQLVIYIIQWPYSILAQKKIASPIYYPGQKKKNGHFDYA